MGGAEVLSGENSTVAASDEQDCFRLCVNANLCVVATWRAVPASAIGSGAAVCTHFSSIGVADRHIDGVNDIEYFTCRKGV